VNSNVEQEMHLHQTLPAAVHLLRINVQDSSLFKPLLAVASVTALLLLVPFTAMHLTSEVRWGVEDFVLAALLLFGTGAGMVLVARRAKRTGPRIAFIGLLAFTFVLVWAELAVGIFT
jgi:hypothetical protein